ncbi:MAG: DUF3383 domain-containing protein [bacterium]|nr:DUF3383 domain-containing protein [bacterium]
MGVTNGIVKISINRGTKIVSRQGFGIPLILGSNATFAERRRIYTDIDEVLVDFPETTAEYRMAKALFSQTIKPAKIKIGRVGTKIKQKVNVSIDSVIDNTDYKIKINDSVFSVNSGTGKTASEIVDLLIASITAGSEPVATTDNGDDFDIEANILGVDFKASLLDKANMTLKAISTYNETITDALNAIRLEDNDFYFILATTRTKSEIKEIAGLAETSVNLYVACTFDSDSLSTSSDNVIKELEALNYDNTAIIYSADAFNMPEGVWVGITAPEEAGSIAWGINEGKGVNADNLTATESTNAQANNGNIFVVRGGLSVFLDGKVASGEWIDIIRGTAWLNVNLEAEVYQVLVNSKKVGYTNIGANTVRTAIAKVLNQAVRMGILASNPAPSISIPDVLDISETDRGNRRLPDISFSARYAGAIQFVEIQGDISV